MKRRRPGLANGFLLPLRPDPGPYHGHDSRFLAGRVTGPEAAVVGEDEEEEEEGEGDDAVVVAAAAAEEEEEGPERRCRCKLESSRSVLKACVLPALTQRSPRKAPCSRPARALSAGSRPSPSLLSPLRSWALPVPQCEGLWIRCSPPSPRGAACLLSCPLHRYESRGRC